MRARGSSPDLRRPAKGFTLVEVLIAVGITASMAVMTVGSLRSMDRASDAARLQDERYAGARVALARLSREVSMAFLSDNYDTARLPRSADALHGPRRRADLLDHVPHPALPGRQGVAIGRSSRTRSDSDPDHSGERALFRREKPRLDDEPDRGGRTDLVTDHVTSLRLPVLGREADATGCGSGRPAPSST